MAHVRNHMAYKARSHAEHSPAQAAASSPLGEKKGCLRPWSGIVRMRCVRRRLVRGCWQGPAMLQSSGCAQRPACMLCWRCEPAAQPWPRAETPLPPPLSCETPGQVTLGRSIAVSGAKLMSMVGRGQRGGLQELRSAPRREQGRFLAGAGAASRRRVRSF